MLYQRIEIGVGKETKRFLRKIYYSPQSKSSILLGGMSRYKTLARLEILYVLVDSSQNQKKTFFFLASHAPRN